MFARCARTRLGNAVALAAAFALYGCPPGNTQSGHHNHGHADNHDWYEGLKRPDAIGSCCNKLKVATTGETIGDCRPTRATIGRDGIWRALIDGDWTPVPPEKVLPAELNQDPLQAHICAHVKTKEIYCFLPKGAGG